MEYRVLLRVATHKIRNSMKTKAGNKILEVKQYIPCNTKEQSKTGIKPYKVKRAWDITDSVYHSKALHNYYMYTINIHLNAKSLLGLK
jgi:hypothetical protein